MYLISSTRATVPARITIMYLIVPVKFCYKTVGSLKPHGRSPLPQPRNDLVTVNFTHLLSIVRGPGSSVGIATDYGLDGPGSNPGGDEILRPSRPALGPTQPSVKWVPGLSRGKERHGRAADHSPPSSAAVMEE